jgi:polyphosphate kinase
MTNPSLSGRGSALHGGLSVDKPKAKYKKRVD